jgi:hypothetical protein
MLPDNVASSVAVTDQLQEPDLWVTTPLVDYEMGGVDLLDASQGMMVKTWRCWLDNLEVKVQGGMGDITTLFTGPRITELSLTFDQNMRWCVAYMQYGKMFLRWYDTTVGDHVITELGEGRNARVSLDDKRPSQTTNSDIIVAYIRGDALYYRQQRERFGVERLLRDSLFPGAILRNIGMGRNYRMQFELV